MKNRIRTKYKPKGRKSRGRKSRGRKSRGRKSRRRRRTRSSVKAGTGKGDKTKGAKSASKTGTWTARRQELWKPGDDPEFTSKDIFFKKMGLGKEQIDLLNAHQVGPDEIIVLDTYETAAEFRKDKRTYKLTDDQLVRMTVWAKAYNRALTMRILGL